MPQGVGEVCAQCALCFLIVRVSTNTRTAYTSRDLLSIPRAPRVVANPEDPTTRILLLRDDIDPVWDADSTHIIHAHGISDSTAQLLRTNGWPLVQHTVTLDHQHWSAIEILEALLPADAADFGCSFETVGHIAHLNLRDELLPYRKMIGEVILDVGTSVSVTMISVLRNASYHDDGTLNLQKNGPKIRTVVTKTGNIETKFRTFPMEVIAGDEDFEATVVCHMCDGMLLSDILIAPYLVFLLLLLAPLLTQSENGCRFRFDFSRVYWNSRLGHEHERVLKLFHAGDIICDVFAGVGPFALPANKSGCIVYANDLNPYSYEAIRANAALNKIAVGGDSSRLHIYNEDGRTFIRHVLHDVRRNVERAGDADKKRTTPQHFVMNLPALAIEFLDAFAGVFREAFGENAERVDQSAMPWVHCHCFSKSETPEADVVEVGRVKLLPVFLF